ncbi:MAG: hypothetical protein WBQ48_06730, partial [Aeromicrobium sp.]
PDWSIADVQEYVQSSPCAGDWASEAGGGSGGNFDVSTNGETGQVWHEVVGFPSVATASSAARRLVENLESCETTEWSDQPLDQAGSVLVSSADGLIWVGQKGSEVGLVSAVTTDGPPPQGVQVKIADLIMADLTRLHDERRG